LYTVSVTDFESSVSKFGSEVYTAFVTEFAPEPESGFSVANAVGTIMLNSIIMDNSKDIFFRIP
jgi:hypothetical protein